MRKSFYIHMLLALPLIAMMSSCEPRALTEEEVFTQEKALAEQLASENPEGYKIYTLDSLLEVFMTEQGNFSSDSSRYRTRSNDSKYPDIYLFSIDTIRKGGPGIYIRGRVTTDDYAGNFYKSMVIQQVVDGEQQNLRISLDMGSSHGLYQLGQELLIRCNGLAVGRYANQPQLCVPSYNNNVNAYHADEKVGWAPGRIPSSVFRSITRMLGAPDQSKLKYDTLSLTQLYSKVDLEPTIDAAGMAKVRKADGLLVCIRNVHFTGQYSNYGVPTDCNTLHPDSSEYANVFGPTTQNVGYPQGRIFSDEGEAKSLICSTSEYAKYAHYYLPGANKDGIADCKNYEGTVTGVLGWYMDNAGSFPGSSKDRGDNITSYKYNWSVTPRGIKGLGIEDIRMTKDLPEGGVEEWIPKEFNPNDYNH